MVAAGAVVVVAAVAVLKVVVASVLGLLVWLRWLLMQQRRGPLTLACWRLRLLWLLWLCWWRLRLGGCCRHLGRERSLLWPPSCWLRFHDGDFIVLFRLFLFAGFRRGGFGRQVSWRQVLR